MDPRPPAYAELEHLTRIFDGRVRGRLGNSGRERKARGPDAYGWHYALGYYLWALIMLRLMWLPFIPRRTIIGT